MSGFIKVVSIVPQRSMDLSKRSLLLYEILLKGYSLNYSRIHVINDWGSMNSLKRHEKVNKLKEF